jgi:hypothetical protein
VVTRFRWNQRSGYIELRDRCGDGDATVGAVSAYMENISSSSSAIVSDERWMAAH